MSIVSSFSAFSAMVGLLPVVVLGIEEVADILAKAVSYDRIVSTPDFDLSEVVTQEEERCYLIQGALTGESVLVRRGAC